MRAGCAWSCRQQAAIYVLTRTWGVQNVLDYTNPSPRACQFMCPSCKAAGALLSPAWCTWQATVSRLDDAKCSAICKMKSVCFMPARYWHLYFVVVLLSDWNPCLKIIFTDISFIFIALDFLIVNVARSKLQQNGKMECAKYFAVRLNKRLWLADRWFCWLVVRSR